MIFYVNLRTESNDVIPAKLTNDMNKQERRHGQEHVDESEVWKRKTLNSAANRRKMAKIMNVIMWAAAAAVIAACVLAYFVDK